MADKIRAAVIGVGHLGRYHAQKYAGLPSSELIGIMDPDGERLRAVSDELGVPGFSELAALLPLVDAVSIASTTKTHFEVGMACLNAGKHTLIEKPLAATPEEGEALVALAREKGVVMQVGYLERFNPAFVACSPRIDRPQFIEAIRITPFAGRGVDVDVVLDLMSHDIDLVSSLVKSPLRDLQAVGISLMTSSTDLANARLTFENGCIANLTASRISSKGERKMRLFQRNRYFSIDFSEPSAREYVTHVGVEGEIPVREEHPRIEKGDALLEEIAAFLRAIQQGSAPVVSGEDGLLAMTIAGKVMHSISTHVPP